MGTRTVRQTMFTMGQVDPVNYKRTDFRDYLKAAQKLLNAEVGTTGLAKKRKGSKFLIDVTAYAQPNSNIYEFTDKNGRYYLVLSADLAMHVFTIVGDLLTFHQTIVTPYASADLDDLDYSEDNDALVFAHPDFIPSRLFISDYVPATPTFEFEALNIFPFPAFDFGKVEYKSLTVDMAGANVTNTFTITAPSDPGFTTDWIGGQIIGGGDSVEDPLGYGIISDVVPWDGAVVVFTLDVKVPFKIPGSTKGSEYSVRQPSWSDVLGYPKKIAFYQNRLWFTNTLELPGTLFASQINEPVNFDVGVGDDTDAIIYTIGQSQTGGIVWVNPGKQLEIYTENFEFVAPQDVNTALTPGTFSIRQQSAYGASSCFKPLNYLNDSYFVTKTGKALINYRFDGIGQTYTSTNVSAATSSLIKNPFNRALLRGTDTSQDNFVYLLNEDDTVTTFQFAMQAGLAALTPADFERDADGNVTVEVVDIFTINNEIYFLKCYLLTGIYAIEKFVEDFKIDSYIERTMDTDGLVTGLEQFEGYVVEVFFENQDYGQYEVVGGEVTADNPNEDSGDVQVGFLYPFEIETMFIFAGAERSNWTKHITEINVDYFESLNFFINGKLVAYQQYDLIQEEAPLTPQTDTAIIYPARGWNRFSTVKITQNSPFDCQILGISYNITADIVS